MSAVFLKIVNTAVSAGWIVLAVLLLRLLLRKAPKWLHVLLWGVVALRLILPVFPQSVFSLIPSTETLPDKLLSGPSFKVNTGFTPVDQRVNEYLGDRYFEGVTVPVGNGRNVMTALAVVWTAGAVILLAYLAVSSLRMRLRLSGAVRVGERTFQCERITVPFVFGFFRPAIYLPADIDSRISYYVIRHEQAHIRRGDQWWKLLGFLLLAVYWFHPLIWAAYLLLCRDIELACDEKAIRGMSREQLADYSQALLSFSVKRKREFEVPPAFGGLQIKKRIQHILNYRKPALGIVAAAVVICAVLAVCFLTDPRAENSNDIGQGQKVENRSVDGSSPGENFFSSAHGMSSTAAELHGIWNGYLFLDLYGQTYRYEMADVDPDTATQAELLDEFTEQPGETFWRIYAVQESPDHSVVLARTEQERNYFSDHSVAAAGEKEDNTFLWRYSPPKRSDPDALQNAKDAGCVVMENGTATFGQEVWQSFVQTTERGESSQVQVAHYHTLDETESTGEYYEAVKEDYPILYLLNLEFDGENYTLHWTEEDTEYVRTYCYLMHYHGGDPDEEFINGAEDIYVLTNDNTVTWTDIVRGMLSSQSGDAIDHYVVYRENEKER